MRSVGIRELKNRLSEFVRLVRGGEDILVTDRGVVVAELRPPGTGPTSAYPALDRLAREGLARLGAPNEPALYGALPRATQKVSAEELIDAERGRR